MSGAVGSNRGDISSSRGGPGPTTLWSSASLYQAFIRLTSRALFQLLHFNPCQDESWRSYPEWKPPNWSGRSKTVQCWLAARRELEAAPDLWRVHDGLYDLGGFIESHPGGVYWLQVTKGTDITEAFESHHLSEKARQLLPKFYVREADTPRNSPFTFQKSGFYSTLRRKVQEKLKGVKLGPSTRSKLMIDSLFLSTLVISILTAEWNSPLLALVSALCLTATVITAHNFFHQRDNWRMHLFSLSGLSVRDWRISHSMSHHLYTNSLHDLEITMFEPWFQWLPRPDKSVAARFLALFYWPVVWLLLFVAEAMSRLLTEPDGARELIPLILPGAMLAVGVPLGRALSWWLLILLSSSFIFALIGLNAAHHHPEIFHDGDKPREERDWGLYQLDTVRDRKEIKGLLPLVLVLFGDHTLHHMFPTIDHAHLEQLYPLLEETCREFKVDFTLMTIPALIAGQFRQLMKVNKSKP